MISRFITIYAQWLHQDAPKPIAWGFDMDKLKSAYWVAWHNQTDIIILSALFALVWSFV